MKTARPETKPHVLPVLHPGHVHQSMALSTFYCSLSSLRVVGHLFIILYPGYFGYSAVLSKTKISVSCGGFRATLNQCLKIILRTSSTIEE